MAKSKHSRKNKNIYYSEGFQRFLNYLIYLLILVLLGFSIYKVFNWQRIFGPADNIETKQKVERNIILPSIVRSSLFSSPNSSSSSDSNTNFDFNYDQKVFLEDMIDNLKQKEIDIVQIEQSENPIDVTLLTKDGYKILLSFNTSPVLLLDNMYSVLDSSFLKEEISKEGGIKNLEYVDFRFENKVFYRFKSDKPETEHHLPSSTATTTATSSSFEASSTASTSTSINSTNNTNVNQNTATNTSQ
ncbi:MAG: hypothetical protein QG614_562 [Patescibacteria group bacterium]|nr:hypothetical protein [Patescibacteria group bacterium]